MKVIYADDHPAIDVQRVRVALRDDPHTVYLCRVDGRLIGRIRRDGPDDWKLSRADGEILHPLGGTYRYSLTHAVCLLYNETYVP